MGQGGQGRQALAGWVGGGWSGREGGRQGGRQGGWEGRSERGFSPGRWARSGAMREEEGAARRRRHAAGWAGGGCQRLPVAWEGGVHVQRWCGVPRAGEPQPRSPAGTLLPTGGSITDGRNRSLNPHTQRVATHATNTAPAHSLDLPVHRLLELSRIVHAHKGGAVDLQEGWGLRESLREGPRGAPRTRVAAWQGWLRQAGGPVAGSSAALLPASPVLAASPSVCQPGCSHHLCGWGNLGMGGSHARSRGTRNR